MRESKLERYLVEQVEKRGGMAEKFVSPDRRFVPDRIVTWPGGHMQFVELKGYGGGLSSGQRRDHERRILMGCEVFVVRTKEQVDAYVVRREASRS